jgi:hypothetical protein
VLINGSFFPYPESKIIVIKLIYGGFFMHKPMFERDLLYPTDSLLEPGSVRVAVLNPDVLGKLPILIIPKTSHNPLEYINILIDIIQVDIFNRIRINIKDQGIFFFKVNENEYVKLIYEDGKQVTEKCENFI